TTAGPAWSACAGGDGAGKRSQVGIARDYLGEVRQREIPVKASSRELAHCLGPGLGQLLKLDVVAQASGVRLLHGELRAYAGELGLAVRDSVCRQDVDGHQHERQCEHGEHRVTRAEAESPYRDTAAP